MRVLILAASVAFIAGCTGGSSNDVANDPKLEHLQRQVDREKAITADIKRNQEEGR